MQQRHLSYWERNLTLSESPSGSLPTHSDIVIVGGGLMGRWLAYWMTRFHPKRGVIVLEADCFGYGASTRNAGFLTAGQISEYLEDVQEFGFDGVAENFLARRRGLALVKEEFPNLALDQCGSVDFDPIDDEKRELAQRLNDLAGERVFQECQFSLGGQIKKVHFSDGDAGLDPVDLLENLSRRSKANFFYGQRVREIGNGIAFVGKETLRYGRAFICTNAFASELDPGSMVEAGRGQILLTTPVESSTSAVLGFLDRGYDYFRFVDGRLLVGGGRHIDRDLEATSEMATTSSNREYLRKVAAKIIGHHHWSVDYHWAGIMGFIEGKHVGGSQRRSLDSQTEVVAGFGGMGVALTPIIAQMIARSL